MLLNKPSPLIALSLLALLGLSGCNTNQKADTGNESKIKVEQDVAATQTHHPQLQAQPQANELYEQEITSSSVRSKAKKELHRESKGQVMQDYVGMAAPSVATSNLQPLRMASEPLDRENYAHMEQNRVKLVADESVSTFSIDVDTGSYANVRRFLNQGRMPPQDAVRIEEMINYFDYDYQGPSSRKQPFRVTTEMAPAPWNTDKQLLHIGIKGYDVDKQKLPASNLVFLLDVSGSMMSDNKLGLLKRSLKMLTSQLSSKDSISIVVYAGATGVVLEPTPGNQHGKINAALEQLRAGGSTNGGAGIRLAYSMAEQAFIKGGVNRVILATDGDFNVGTVNFESLIDLVEEKRKSGIALTTLGFGTGNYNDKLMEQLADHGNGNYAYIDTINEARKVLVDELSATLLTIAKDVKIQIEFNPDVVSEYRLIGYENRMLNREDFNNDQVDAGEIGAGHTVTALYELTLKGTQGMVDPLRYGKEKKVRSRNSAEIAFLRLRYKQPDADKSQLIEYPLQRKMMKNKLSKSTDRFRLSAAVAVFGDLLRGGKYSNGFTYADTIKLAQGVKQQDQFGFRGELLNLMRTANTLSGGVHHRREQEQLPGDGMIVE